MPTIVHPHNSGAGEGLLAGDATVVPASDDWPFFYMIKPSRRNIYLVAIAMVITMALLLGGAMTPAYLSGVSIGISSSSGAAFMLLDHQPVMAGLDPGGQQGCGASGSRGAPVLP